MSHAIQRDPPSQPDAGEEQPKPDGHITYWLEHNKQFVSSVIAPRNLPDQTVRFLAARQFERVPLCDRPRENPRDRRRRILHSKVRRFERNPHDLC